MKQARKSLTSNGRRMTQEELAKRLGVSRGPIINIECGRSEPNPIFVKLFCQSFGISEEWLRTGAGSMFAATESRSRFSLICTEIDASDDLFIKGFIQTYWSMDEREQSAVKKLLGPLLPYADK